MTVYIEYAFLENFLYDCVLLSLALTAARVKKRWLWIFLSAACGGIFAIVYPFIRLPSFLDIPLKLSVGLALCLLAHGYAKRRKEWGRYALTCALFFAFSFSFGGALVACSQGKLFQKVPALAVFTAFAALSGVSLLLIKKLYARRAVYAYMYDCEISFSGRKIRAQGFLDSGNTARKNGMPVCFLAPDLFYELCGNALLWQAGEREKIRIVTISGEREFPLFKGEISVKGEGFTTRKEVYFANGANILSREYEILLNAGVLEG